MNLTSENGVKPPKDKNDAEAPNKDGKPERLAELMNLISDEKLLLIFKTIFSLAVIRVIFS